MQRLLLSLVTIICLTSCGQTNSNKPSNNSDDTTTLLTKFQRMDTVHFWKIIDYGFEKGGFDNKIKEQAILEQLIKLTPEQIQEFEIIFQQMNKKSSTWVNFASQTVIEGGSSDDRFYYFRCWLISLGKKHFDATLKNPDYLASLEIPFNKEYRMMYCQFEELIPMADRAYEIVTKKDPAKDTSFPRPHAEKLGLFYDSGTDIAGTEWQSNDELLKIVPQLCKKYLNK
jgi:Protein of unknown function (DUF4240)